MIDINSLSLEEKILQTKVAQMKKGEKITEQVGAAFFFGEIITEADEMGLDAARKTLAEYIDNADIPILITSDFENGCGSMLKGLTPLPYLMSLGAANSEKLAYDYGKATALEARSVGANWSFSPVCDLNINKRNPLVNVRGLTDDVNLAIKLLPQVIKGMQDNGLAACAKHFPGHGDTAVDSHLGLPRVDKMEEALEQLELIPFRRAIEAGVPAIMMSHVLFPNIEPEQVPCTMSRRMVTGLLKQKLGFRGLILTDCMEMGAIRDYYGTPEGVVASIKAGVDLAEISSAFDLELAAAKAVNEAAERGEFDVEEIRASVEKILCYKKMLAAQAEPGLCNQPEDRRAAESMARQAISQISGTPFRADENTFFCGCADYRASGAANADGSAVTFPEYMANAFGAEGFVTGKDPDEEEIRAALRQAENCEKIILGTCNGHLFRGQLALAEALAATGKPMAVAALRNPYDLSRLPETVWKLAVYDYAVPAFRALEDIFRGGKATGVCPVKLL